MVIFWEVGTNIYTYTEFLGCRNNTYYILASEGNASRIRWGDRVNNERGRYISNWRQISATQYKTKMFTPLEPTFKPASTYLDICIADSRLGIAHSFGNKIPIVPYDSDHNAILYSVSLPNIYLIDVDPTSCAKRFNYKATDWKRFKKKLESRHQLRFPDNTNLTIPEIDQHLLQINNEILTVIDEVVPVI